MEASDPSRPLGIGPPRRVKLLWTAVGQALGEFLPTCRIKNEHLDHFEQQFSDRPPRVREAMSIGFNAIRSERSPTQQ